MMQDILSIVVKEKKARITETGTNKVLKHIEIVNFTHRETVDQRDFCISDGTDPYGIAVTRYRRN